MDKDLQGQCLRIVSPVSPAGLYCCYAVIMVLSGAVIALSVALSFSVRKKTPAIVSPEAGYATCPRDWIGFGSKCFYFSEHTSNWTSSQTSCMDLGASLTQAGSLEELNFLNRSKGDSTAWIGLHRESPEHPWMWTDNTEYKNLISIRGDGNHAYLSDRGISSGRGYMQRKWICSKSSSYTLQCPRVEGEAEDWSLSTALGILRQVAQKVCSSPGGASDMDTTAAATQARARLHLKMALEVEGSIIVAGRPGVVTKGSLHVGGPVNIKFCLLLQVEVEEGETTGNPENKVGPLWRGALSQVGVTGSINAGLVAGKMHRATAPSVRSSLNKGNKEEQQELK
ncbi:hypothetical protein U0070_000971, partial [Myodes glareolus]